MSPIGKVMSIADRPNDCTWKCRLGRSETGCEAVAVRVAPLTCRHRAMACVSLQSLAHDLASGSISQSETPAKLVVDDPPDISE